ncbi:MAG TPA: hypothetical protein ENJ99_02355, partial [Rhizobiales bacterium]|nr:hypothetical protein [Hyphomicrobiales bacterium]
MRQINEHRLAALDELTHQHLTMPQAARPQPKGISKFENWRLVLDTDNIAWAILDKKGASANTLAEAVLREMDKMLDEAK